MFVCDKRTHDQQVQSGIYSGTNLIPERFLVLRIFPQEETKGEKAIEII